MVVYLIFDVVVLLGINHDVAFTHYGALSNGVTGYPPIEVCFALDVISILPVPRMKMPRCSAFELHK